MRGDDLSSRYPPRGVWFGLFLAVGTVRVSWRRMYGLKQTRTGRAILSCWPPPASRSGSRLMATGCA